MKFSRTLLSAAAAVAAFAAMPASALTTYVFNNPGSAFVGGPFGTVDLAQNGTSVDFTVTLASGFNFVTTGNQNSHAAFTFNGLGVALVDITSIASAGGGAFAAWAPGNNGPFGTFGFGIHCTDCKNGAGGQQADPLTFSVLNAVESDFAFTSTGGTAAYFAADVITGSTTGAVGVTGTGVPVPNIPEPETYALMLAGLGVLGFVARRRKSV